MVVTYHSGGRIQGTSTDFATIPAISGGWKEVGRTTLGSSSTSYSVASLPDKRYYMFLVNNFNLAQVEGDSLQFNGGGANTHAYRYSVDGATDGVSGNRTKLGQFGFHPHSQPSFAVGYVSNLLNQEKLGITYGVGQSSNVSGAGNAPNRGNVVFKYQPNAVIDEIGQITGWSTFNSGSELVILGWDDTDTHTTNFWEELASVELGSQASEIDSGTFTAKKYLWMQMMIKKDSTASNFSEFSVNDITTGSTYSRRISTNGGADGTNVSQNTMGTSNSGAGTYFFNYFIINNSANEKLVIAHSVENQTTGAGTAPSRIEMVIKSSLTGSQITSMKFTGATNGYEAGSFLKVWGSD